MPQLKFADAIGHLRLHNKGSLPPDDDAILEGEEREFSKIEEAERREAEKRCPSLRSIPRFYERKASPLDESNSLRPRILREARAYMLQRKSNEELLEEDDLHVILALLREGAKEYAKERGVSGEGDTEVIDYQGFAKIREEVSKKGKRFRQFFLPSTFLKFPRDQNGCIAIVPFFTFVVRKVNIKQTRVQLSYYDQMGCGYLREKDMENFIFELIPTLPQLGALQEEFYPFYVFTAVRKFFFFLDPKRTGKVRIRDLLSSQILLELYELRGEQPAGLSEDSSNWFSMQSSLKVYGQYLEMDVDQNGMLSKKELGRYGNGMLTDVFIDRVFEEYQTYKDAETGEREMDYKTFLDFVLAMENKNTNQAIHYLWKLIDIHHKGYLDSFVINYFFRAVLKRLQSKNIDSASVDDVKDEIFDMVKPAQPSVITLDDLIQCRQGGTVLSMLIDAAAFWKYDNRESLMMDADDEDPGF